MTKLIKYLILFIFAVQAHSQPAKNPVGTGKLLAPDSTKMNFSTFLGGTEFDIIRDVTTSSDGSIYVAGNTISPDFPVIDGAYDTVYEVTALNYSDIFIAKFSPDGSRLLACTYIGGRGDDYAEAIELDLEGNLIVTGYTYPLGEFPVSEGSFDDSPNGGYDAYILKITPDLSSIIYSTLIGGSNDDFATGLVLKNGISPVITGYTMHDTDFPFRDENYNTNRPGATDAFVFQLEPDGSNSVFSSQIGGTGDDFGHDIDIDSEGNIYIAGITRSNNIPFPADALDRSFNDKNADSHGDAFLVKVSTDGSQLITGTYFGGAAEDAPYGMEIGQDGAVYIAGYTESADFPVSSNAFISQFQNETSGIGNGDAFVAKFDSDLKNIIYSSYFGGIGSETAYDIAVDILGNAHFAGFTNSDDFPMSRKTFSDSHTGEGANPDAFLVKMNASGDNIIFSSFIGGTGRDIANSIYLMPSGEAIIGGRTTSEDFPVSPAAYDTTYNDSSAADIYLMDLSPNLLNADAGDDFLHCIGDTSLIGAAAEGGLGGLTITWSPDKWLTRNDTLPVGAFPERDMSYYLEVRDGEGNVSRDTIEITVVPLPEFELIGNIVSEADSTERYYALDDELLFKEWEVFGGEVIGSSDLDSIDIKWRDTIFGIIRVKAENSNGCVRTIERRIILNFGGYFELTFDGRTEFCEGGSLMLDAGAGYDYYFWNDGTEGRFNNAETSGEYWCAAFDSQGFGFLSDTVFVNVNDNPDPVITGETKVSQNTIHTYSIENPDSWQIAWFAENGVIVNDMGNSVNVEWSGEIECKIIASAISDEGCIGQDTLDVLAGVFDRPVINYDGNGYICEGEELILDAGPGYIEYFWSDGTRTRRDTISESGSYWVRVKDINGAMLYSDTVEIESVPNPPKPLISFNNGFLRCQNLAEEYLWYIDGVPRPDLNQRQFKAEISGSYQCEITAQSGCSSLSDPLEVIVGSVDEFEGNFVEINQRIIRAGLTGFISPSSLKILDLNGKTFYSASVSGENAEIDISGLPSGVYLLIIENAGFVWEHKFIRLN